MKILFINNDGGGFADYVEVAEGTTVQQLFERQVANAKPEHYLIRVNRQPTAADQALQEGDRVSITPTKIEGARLRFPASPCRRGGRPHVGRLARLSIVRKLPRDQTSSRGHIHELPDDFQDDLFLFPETYHDDELA